MNRAIRLRKICLTAALTAAALLATQAARADPTLSIDGNSQTLTPDGFGSFTFSGTVDGFSVNLQVTSTSIPTRSRLIDLTINVTNTDAGQNQISNQVSIQVTNDYIQPTGTNITLLNSFTGNAGDGDIDSAQQFTGQAFYNSGVAGNTIALNSTGLPVLFDNSDTPFQLMALTTLTLAQGVSAFTAGSVTVTAAATPEPATLVLAASGLATLGLVGLRRRSSRRATVNA